MYNRQLGKALNFGQSMQPKKVRRLRLHSAIMKGKSFKLPRLAQLVKMKLGVW